MDGNTAPLFTPATSSRVVETPAILAPPFNTHSAVLKLRAAENAWNSCNPSWVIRFYTIDCQWRDGDKFLSGHDAIRQFLADKWKQQLDYRLVTELVAVKENIIALRSQSEWHDIHGQYFRSYGNEFLEVEESGLVSRREASINNQAIDHLNRRFHWRSYGRRPLHHWGLSGKP